MDMNKVKSSTQEAWNERIDKGYWTSKSSFFFNKNSVEAVKNNQNTLYQKYNLWYTIWEERERERK